MLTSRFFALAIVLGLARLLPAATTGTEARAAKLVLTNPHLSVQIDRQTGALISLRDKDLGVVYRLQGTGFLITTDRG